MEDLPKNTPETASENPARVATEGAADLPASSPGVPDLPVAAPLAESVAAPPPESPAPESPPELPVAADSFQAESGGVIADSATPSTPNDDASRPAYLGRGPKQLLGLGALLLGAASFAFVAGRGQTSSANGHGETASTITVSAPTASIAVPKEESSQAAIAAEERPAAPPPIWRVSLLSKDPTVDLLDGALGSRSIASTLLALKVSKTDSARVIALLKELNATERPQPKDVITVGIDRASSKLVALEYATAKHDIWQLRADENGELTGKKLELPVEERHVAVAFRVGDDLRASLAAAGLDDAILKILDDALEGHVELSEIRPGARLRVIATEERVGGEFSRYVDLHAVEYAPANGRAPIRVFHLDRAISRKNAGFYDSRGRQPFLNGWRSPIPLARISSRFNPKRKHPVLHTIMPHQGVDFAASTGTPVYSASPGLVSSVGDGGPCGNMVQITHATGIVSVYCHLSRFAAHLHPGQRVESRQVVGYVGATGRVTGPHLHFGIKRNGLFIDPMRMKLDGFRVVPPSDREAFARVRQSLEDELNTIALPPPPSELEKDDGRDKDKDEVMEELP